jgi:ribose 5-phosphate isomerase RpiB
MKVAVINEISAADKNGAICQALSGRGYEVLNLGNTSSQDQQALLYTHTGLMSALLLHLKLVDFVIGGCGTGQGYLNSVLQYPGVVCGHLLTPLDAFLFARINAGNCVSLALNQGYGWAGEVNLRLMFDVLFTPETGNGYPSHRSEAQREGREGLAQVSFATHRSIAELLPMLPAELVRTALTYPPFRSVLESAREMEPELRIALTQFGINLVSKQ